MSNENETIIYLNGFRLMDAAGRSLGGDYQWLDRDLMPDIYFDLEEGDILAICDLRGRSERQQWYGRTRSSWVDLGPFPDPMTAEEMSKWLAHNFGE